MPFRELSPLAKEMYLRTQIEQLVQIYGRAQKSLAAELNRLNLTELQKVRAEGLLRQIEAVTAGLNKDTYRWAKNTLPQAYDRGIDLAAERLKALNVTRFVSYDANIHTSAISALIEDVSVELIMANNSIPKFFNRFIMQTQQRLLEDNEITRLISEGLIKGEARRTVSDTILQNLRKQMGNEQFIVINGRNYKPEGYAKLVARTRTREASSQGTINTSLRYGIDLVQWDAHLEPCEYCQQFSGRVYSISGNDPNFPDLTEKPPLHPNCKCVITPITRESMQHRGYIDELIKLSNSPLTKIDSFSRFEEVLAAL